MLSYDKCLFTFKNWFSFIRSCQTKKIFNSLVTKSKLIQEEQWLLHRETWIVDYSISLKMWCFSSLKKTFCVFSCRTESAAALEKTFLGGTGRGVLRDVSKFLSTCTLKNSVGDQHVVSMLPACCLHVASMLPVCCQHDASMLPVCCQLVASRLLACCQYVARILLACCQHVDSMLTGYCLHIVAMLPTFC